MFLLDLDDEKNHTFLKLIWRDGTAKIKIQG